MNLKIFDTLVNQLFAYKYGILTGKGNIVPAGMEK